MRSRKKRAGSITPKKRAQRRGLDPRLIKYLLSKKGQHLDFAKHFSGEVITSRDRKDLRQFIQAMRLRKKGYGAPTIGRRVGRSTGIVGAWIAGNSAPRVVWLARAYIELGPPKPSYTWRQLTRTRRGLPPGPWTQAPDKGKFADLEEAIGSKKVAEIAKIEPELIKHIVNTKVLNTKFLRDFWQETATRKDIKELRQYAKAIKLRLKGYPYKNIADRVQRSTCAVHGWMKQGRKPRIIRLLNLHLRLGKPRKGWKWLVTFERHTGFPVKPIIQVSQRINNFDDIVKVLDQLTIRNQALEHAKKFRLTLTDVKRLRPELFGFLLGTLVGDAGKQARKRQRILSMDIQLNLTKSHDSNLRLGEFVCLCANAIGLKMHRTKDAKPAETHPAGEYRWRSESSTLVGWIVKCCLGMKKGQKTTYHPVNINWILSSPDYFRRSFLQGVAESDAGVKTFSYRLEFSTYPNNKTIQCILASLGVKSRQENMGKFNRVVVYLKYAYDSGLLNPYVDSYRYKRMNRLVKAKRFVGRWPQWFADEVEKLIAQRLRPIQIIDALLDKYGILVTYPHVLRRYRKTSRRRTTSG